MHNLKPNKFVRFIIFLGFNFLALGVGTLLMENGPQANWYTNLNQAPWTPPGWVFGAMWTTIMIFFSIYMTQLSLKFNFLNKKIITLYTIQWILNVSWNYVFFNQQKILLGLFVIVSLLFLVLYFMVTFFKALKNHSYWILLYFVWLCIATSLNAYIYIYN